MGCIYSTALFEEKELESSFITLRFDSEQKPKSLKKKVKNECESLDSSPASIKTRHSVKKHLKKKEIFKDFIVSGELMKYHPGISSQFISRFCVLTPFLFKYYKSHHSYNLGENPLFSIAISEIASVTHVEFKTPEKQLKFEKNNNDYQFEIFLRQEDEITALSRKIDRLPLDRDLLLKTTVIKLEDSIQTGKIMKKALRENVKSEVFLERTTWTVREHEWCAAEKRLLFSAKDPSDASRWVCEIEKLIPI